MVVGSNLGGLKFNLLFAKNLVWPEYERVEIEGATKGLKNFVFTINHIKGLFKRQKANFEKE